MLILAGGVISFKKKIEIKPMSSYNPYPFQSLSLSNGLSVLLVRDNSLPYISYSVLFKSGSANDPSDKEGLFHLLNETHKNSSTFMMGQLELLGSGLSYNLQKESFSFTVEGLLEVQKKLLDVFYKIVTQTTITEKDFQKAKRKVIGSLKRSAEDFDYYASRIFNKYLFGSHPYGLYPYGSLVSLKKIQLKDVNHLYHKEFYPKNALLSVSGKLPQDIVAQLESTFGSWKSKKTSPKQTKTLTVQPMFSSMEKEKLLVVNHSSSVQSEIRSGHLSISISHPDYLALKTANVILGNNSLGSHLARRIRVQKGLTYHVYSYFNAKKELGAFVLGMAVRHSRVGDALLESDSILRSFRKTGLTQEELKSAKAQLTTRFVRDTAIVEDFTQYLMFLNSQNLPYSFAKNYLKNINQLTVQQVNQAIKEHLHPNQMKWLIFSRSSDIIHQLQDYQPFSIKSYKDFL